MVSKAAILAALFATVAAAPIGVINPRIRVTTRTIVINVYKQVAPNIDNAPYGAASRSLQTHEERTDKPQAAYPAAQHHPAYKPDRLTKSSDNTPEIYQPGSLRLREERFDEAYPRREANTGRSTIDGWPPCSTC
jgi:hypothetical protein